MPNVSGYMAVEGLGQRSNSLAYGDLGSTVRIFKRYEPSTVPLLPNLIKDKPCPVVICEFAWVIEFGLLFLVSVISLPTPMISQSI